MESLVRADTDGLLKQSGDQVTEREIFIPARDGSSVRALVYRSTSAPQSDLPLVVPLHDGGFCYGIEEMKAAGHIGAAHAYDCVSIDLEYRLGPGVKFPTPWEDCWDALKWLSSNASSVGANPARGFVLGGTSAGGHLTIPLVHKARDEGLSPQLREKSITLATVSGFCVSVLFSFVSPFIQDKGFGGLESRIGFLYWAISLTAAAWSLFLPEIGFQRLEELDELFQKLVSVWKFRKCQANEYGAHLQVIEVDCDDGESKQVDLEEGYR